MNKEDIKNLVLKSEENNQLVFATIEGFAVADIDNFISQSTQGILYDLNRGKEVVIGFLDDPKWVNDFAVALVITRLKERIDKLEAKNG